MAFCTKCGANLTGAFCTQCGVPSAGATAGPPPPRRGSAMKVVLIVILCLFGVGILGVIGTGAFVAHRMRRAGVDRELFRTHPELAIGRMLAATHPDLEVVETDHDRVTLRNRRSGKRFTMSFDDARRGRFSLEAVDDEGRGGSIEVGEDAKLPSWLPVYPGSQPEPVLSARGRNEEGAGEAGEFRFDTPDLPSQVISFYQDRGREMDLQFHLVRSGETITLATVDDDHDRFLKVVARRDDDRTIVNVTYGRKR